jgi:hypothetical protein
MLRVVAARLVALRFDAIDPRGLAAFWAAALHREAGVRPGDEVALVPADDSRLPVVFSAGAAPKAGQNRNHLDLTTASVDDQRDTVARLLALGARPVDVGQRPDESHVVLGDPEGNELCVLAPGNRFLEGRGRLGAINCDGTRAVGRFWSEVLGRPLVWDQDEETAIRTPGTGPMITWSGPPLIPKRGRNRLYLAIAPEGDRTTELARLQALGATPVDAGDGRLLADPDGNEFRLERGP